MPRMKLPAWALTAFGMKGKKKQPQLSEENPSMFDFSHLSGKTKTKGESDNGNAPLKLDNDDTQITRPKGLSSYVCPELWKQYRLSIVETPDDEIGQIIAGGAFGLSAYDVIYECRDYTLTLMSDETEETALRRVIPSLLYALADDID